MKTFYAHSGITLDKSDWQLLKDHLIKVGIIAKSNAFYFNAGEIAYLAGVLHDLGKYSYKFQSRLAGAKEKVDHATAGAKIAIQQWGDKCGRLVAYAIAGHHTGLANGINEGKNRSTLKNRLEANIPELDIIWESEVCLPKEFPTPDLKSRPNFHGFQASFLIRMLFSCLVDADFIDTESFYNQLENKQLIRGKYANLKLLKIELDSYLKELLDKLSNPCSLINSLRKKILNYAREQSNLAPGLFRMTVPTGGGKTLTSMAFALDHALKFNKRRIIYVVPFTSIIEQNAQIFRSAFGEAGKDSVLEHHSNFDDRKIKNDNTKDKLRLSMENWDAPVIVTTAVQFFESLFADRPSQCRKLHNISGSVIILDEAQILPLKFLLPIMAAIDELARNYQCSLVLCTATQPALLAPDFVDGFENVREIAPNPNELFEPLNMVNTVYIGDLTDEELIEKIKQQHQILVIVNNRRQAQSIFKHLHMLQVKGIFHLTTLMCPAHRIEILDKIREHLKAGQMCKVISTSLIEAGVDISFPRVMRAEAGLDSIAQAAGRCNRERMFDKNDSIVEIFNSPEWKSPPGLDVLAAGTRSIIRNCERYRGNLLSMEAINDYFAEVYWSKAQGLDAKNIIRNLNNHAPNMSFPFQNIADDFRMIEPIMQSIIIPFNTDAEELIMSLTNADNVRMVLRKLQLFVVQIPKEGFRELQRAKVVEIIAEQRLGDQLWQLINPDIYDKEFGLSWDNPNFLKVESTVI